MLKNRIMKFSKINLSTLCILAACLFALSCGQSGEGGESKSTETVETTEAKQDGHDHAGHDHSGHDHSGHDHAGHDHSSHDGHDHGNEGQSAVAVGHVNKGAAYESAYVCPMHCKGSGSDKAGTCPVCKMDYVAIADHTKDGHLHE